MAIRQHKNQLSMTVNRPLPNGTAVSPTNHDPPKPIAICGMACRLPSGISSPRQLWDFLQAGGDARSKVPASRYNVEAFYDPSGKPGTTKTEHGYFLDDDLTKIDTSTLSMPRKELEKLDPQQRLMLKVARECVEDAGEVAWEGKEVGCYIGNLGEDWLEMLAHDTQSFGIYRLTGQGDFSLSNRISYEMNLRGPRSVMSQPKVRLRFSNLTLYQYDRTDRMFGLNGGIARSLCGSRAR
ncbi:hypothetical protein PRZ48_009272 [Zasmidium cellare]|uniref:Ketosynthase family 3 (KS3) domain-containing protein n=1 Tax=Zasmidium cellare TaxID=395010 RepID=A0ABR0EBA7_ZASCE|nr:hypothetical protein PRZ48_009272 [Zasmidium cellare]